MLPFRKKADKVSYVFGA